jgi:transposase
VSRAKNGEAIHPGRRTAKEKARLQALLREAGGKQDLATWRRAKAILGYLDGKSVITMSEELSVDRSAINRWMIWFNAEGIDGLRTGKPPGRAARLSTQQRTEIAKAVEAGPQAAGYVSGVWTLAFLRDWIARRFGTTYHISHVARLLHQLGFSVQRPRKRLARADAEAQARWINERFPAIKKKRPPVEGSSSSKTKPASGSMERSTRPGHG